MARASWVEQVADYKNSSGEYVALGPTLEGCVAFQDVYRPGELVTYTIRCGSVIEFGYGTLVEGTPWRIKRVVPLAVHTQTKIYEGSDAFFTDIGAGAVVLNHNEYMGYSFADGDAGFYTLTVNNDSRMFLLERDYNYFFSVPHIADVNSGDFVVIDFGIEAGISGDASVYGADLQVDSGTNGAVTAAQAAFYVRSLSSPDTLTKISTDSDILGYFTNGFSGQRLVIGDGNAGTTYVTAGAEHLYLVAGFVGSGTPLFTIDNNKTSMCRPTHGVDANGVAVFKTPSAVYNGTSMPASLNLNTRRTTVSTNLYHKARTF